MSETEKKISTAASLMQRSLSESTGLREREQKLVVYYALATHALPTLDTFPLLVLLGKMGTGKSQALKIVENFSHRPLCMSLRGMTGPAIRDKFAEGYEGTAIIEEADAAWKDTDSSFEHMLSDRYQRNSAKASHKKRTNNKDWDLVTKAYFGATVLHRRVSFVDAALDGRSVSVRFRPDHSRLYRDFDAEDPWNLEGNALLTEVTLVLPAVEKAPGIAARVFNSYKPLLGSVFVWRAGSVRT